VGKKKGETISMQFLSISGKIAATVVASTILVSGASAETLDLTCRAADGSQSQRLRIDLTSNLVSYEGSLSGRSWAAHVSGGDFSWDEIFDSRIGHVANHYVYEAASGALHGTDAGGGEIVSAVCHKQT
jgi:hypothetical protein